MNDFNNHSEEDKSWGKEVASKINRLLVPVEGKTTSDRYVLILKILSSLLYSYISSGHNNVDDQLILVDDICESIKGMIKRKKE